PAVLKAAGRRLLEAGEAERIAPHDAHHAPGLLDQGPAPRLEGAKTPAGAELALAGRLDRGMRGDEHFASHRAVEAEGKPEVQPRLLALAGVGGDGALAQRAVAVGIGESGPEDDLSLAVAAVEDLEAH